MAEERLVPHTTDEPMPAIDVLATKLYRQHFYSTHFDCCSLEPGYPSANELTIWREVAMIALGGEPRRRKRA